MEQAGTLKEAGHFTAYINPCLDALNQTEQHNVVQVTPISSPIARQVFRVPLALSATLQEEIESSLMLKRQRLQ